MKLLLCALIVALCTYAGRSAAMRQKRRLRFLNALLREMEPLENRMLRGKLPLKEAFLQCGMRMLCEIGRQMEKQGAYDAWMRVKETLNRQGEEMDCLEEEELKLLENFFSQIGAGGIRQQEILIGTITEELEKVRRSAENACGEKLRLYTALGALAGCALVIMVF